MNDEKGYAFYETDSHIVCVLNGGINSRYLKSYGNEVEVALWQTKKILEMETCGHLPID